MSDDKSSLNDKTVGSAFMKPPPTLVALGLLDWLRAERRQDIPFLPQRYVSIMEVLPRLCAYRLPRGRCLTPWFQDGVESALRQALSDGDLVAWLILEGHEPSKVLPTNWLNPSVWHRAKFNRDMDKPDADYDGEPVSDEAWLASERAAGPPGIYVLERDDVLAWLKVPVPAQPSSPAVARVQSKAANREKTLKRLRAALITHLEFDQDDPPWVKEEAFVGEISDILRTHQLKEFLSEAQRLSDDIRPETHKQRGRRSDHAHEAMNDWLQRMKEKRGRFRF